MISSLSFRGAAAGREPGIQGKMAELLSWPWIAGPPLRGVPE
jgi:hypothetical protein